MPRKQHFIRKASLKKKKPALRFAFDIETNGLDTRYCVLACLQNIDTGAQYVFYTPQQVKDFLYAQRDEYIEETGNDKARVIIFAHNGWKYDFYSLWTVSEIKQANKIDRKGRILVCTINGIECRDYKTIVAEPLSKIGEALGFPKGITPMKFRLGTVEKDGINQEDIKYCLLDCEILSKAVLSLEKTYQDWCRSSEPLELPLTTASMAYSVWSSRFFPDHWFFHNKKGKRQDIAFCKPKFNESLEEAYFGGRVQVICEPMKVQENVISIDRNSMFPAEMKDQVFPDMTRCFETMAIKTNLLNLINSESVVCWADIELEGIGCPTFLPTTDPLGRRCWTSEKFSGWLCEPEIKHALELGYKIKKIRKINYAHIIRPFEGFVDYFYKLRTEMKENNDPSQLWIKLLLNSLYGRFSMRMIALRIDNDEEIEEIMLSNKALNYELNYYDGTKREMPFLISPTELFKKPTSTWFGFAAFITSYARVSLNRAILSAGDAACYTDTDSVFFKAEALPEVLKEVTIGKGLGEWDYEVKTPTNFIAYEPKAYVFVDDIGNKIKIRHKGVSLNDSAGNLLPDAGDLTKEQISRNVVQFRTAMRRGLELGAAHVQVKKSKRHFGKPSPFRRWKK